MKRFILILIPLLVFIGTLAAQPQPTCHQIDCPGRCGMFTDENSDACCDYGHLSAKEKTQPTTVSEQNPEKVSTQVQVKQSPSKVERANLPEKQDTVIKAELQEVNDGAPTECPEAAPEEVQKKSRFDTPYHLISISGGLILIYIITLILTNKKIMTRATHQKIWNTLLAITFLVSGLLGLLLVFFINYSYIPSYYMDIKVIHVEFGIGMAIICIFHLLWHLKYYKAIFKKPKNKQNRISPKN